MNLWSEKAKKSYMMNFYYMIIFEFCYLANLILGPIEDNFYIQSKI